MNPLRAADQGGRGSQDNVGPGIECFDMAAHHGDVIGGGGIYLVNDGDVGQAQIGLPGVIEQFMPRPQGIEEDHVDIGMEERRIVIAPIPDDDLGLLLRPGEDLAIIDPAIDDDTLIHQGFVFLPFFDGDVIPGKIGKTGKALHHLAAQVAVGHGMADDHHFFAVAIIDRSSG